MDMPDTEESVAAASRPHWLRDLVVFLSGQTVTLFGSMLVQYAIMWHLTLVTKSGVVMALAALFGFLPQAVVSIFGGVWADRLNRKWLIIGADAVIAATTLLLAVFLITSGQNGTEAGTLWLIYLTLAIRSAGRGHPDAGGGGDPAPARSRPAPAARERHQRIDPVRHDAARAGGRRCGLRARVHRRDLLHRRRHRGDRHPDDRVHRSAHHPQVGRHRLLRRHGRGRQVHVHAPVRALAAHPVRDRVRAHGRALVPHAAHAGARVRRRRRGCSRCSRSCSASAWWSAGS